MRQTDKTGRKSSIGKYFCAGVATLAVATLGTFTANSGPQQVTSSVALLAAIDESNTTIGFADSDLYGMTPAQIDQQLDQMQAMGVQNVRVIIPWAGVEPIPGYYDWRTVDYMVNAADSRGMGVLGVVNSTPYWAVAPGGQPISGEPASATAYGDFTGMVADRYAGKIGAYEIWNEPNAAMFYSPQPDPAGYIELLKAAYPEIKAADPDAIVIGGVTGSVTDYGNLAMNPVRFVQGIYDAGGQDYFDALSFHPYQYTTPFSQGGYLPDSPINQLTAMRNVMVANGDSTKLIWGSEYGEPTSVASEQTQADYLRDMLTTWRTLDYTGPSFVYTLQDRQTGSTDPEDTFGVVRSDGTWKPAAYVIQQLASQPETAALAQRVALTVQENDMTMLPPAEEIAAAAQVAPTSPAVSEAQAAPTDPMAALGQAVNDFFASLGQQLQTTVAAAMTPQQTATPQVASAATATATGPAPKSLASARVADAAPAPTVAGSVTDTSALRRPVQMPVSTTTPTAESARSVATPATPAAPAIPATPATRAASATPATPATPATAARSATAATPDRPAPRPDRPNPRSTERDSRPNANASNRGAATQRDTRGNDSARQRPADRPHRDGTEGPRHSRGDER